MDRLTYNNIFFSFLNYKTLDSILILGSFILLVLITIGVFYISFISWKDNRRLYK